MKNDLFPNIGKVSSLLDHSSTIEFTHRGYIYQNIVVDIYDINMIMVYARRAYIADYPNLFRLSEYFDICI
jgi:hypothetical protein